MKPSEILTEAKERIRDPAKWIKGRMYKDGAHCSLGAIFFGSNSMPVVESYWIAAGFLRKATGVEITEWNDRHNTTHPMVLAHFDAAIALAESEGR